MNVRCIFCGRPESKVTLSNQFRCIDETDCEMYKNHKQSPVHIWSDCACLYSHVTFIGIGVYTEINKVFAPEYSGSKFLGVGTVYEGEWRGLCYALAVAELMLKENKYLTFKIFADNQSMVRTFNEQYKPNSKSMEHYYRAKNLQKLLGSALQCVLWIPRELNQNADKLSKEAIQHLQPIK